MNSKVAGIILIVSGIAVCVIGGAVLGVFTMAGLTASGSESASSCWRSSHFHFWRGRVLIIKSTQEGKDDEIIAKQRKILDMVATRGQVRISDLALKNLVVSKFKIGFIIWWAWGCLAATLTGKTECCIVCRLRS